MGNQTFIDYIKTPVNGVKPYSILTAALIALVLGLLDTVGCVVLIIAAFVFIKKGHRGLGFLLAGVNIVIPDALPLVDEIAGLVAVILPLYIEWKKHGNIADGVVGAIESQQEYNDTKDNYTEMDSSDAVKTIAQHFQTKE